MQAQMTLSSKKTSRISRSFFNWRLVVLGLLCLVMLLPVFTVFQQALLAPSDLNAHLNEYVLPRVLFNTIVLVVSVTLLSTILGLAAAWCVSMYEFPGRRFFSWALLLPLAIPGYVMAFVMLGVFDFAGPVQNFLRNVFGSSAWFPNIRSGLGAVLALSLCLYPYVYLITRGAFAQQGKRALEVAQSLGHSPRRAIFSLALPLARPWIMAGMLLVMMETLADFGTVAIFNFDTFTTAIYHTWFGMGSLPSALRLAAWLMLFVIVVLLIESRGRQQRYTSMGDALSNSRESLSKPKSFLCTGFCGILFGFAFLIPIVQLLIWFIEHIELAFSSRYLEFFSNTLLLASLGSVLIALLAVVVIALQHALRTRNKEKQISFLSKLLSRLMTMGYAVPGTVLAIGLFVPLVWLSKFLVTMFGVSQLLLAGGLFALLLGYNIRFFAVAFRPVDSQMQRLSSHFEEVSESLGVVGIKKWQQVILPLLRPGILTALALVFVDIMKEMPLTLMTRPFGWDTLAVQIFELTSEGEWSMAAVPAIAIVLVGLLPVYLLNNQREKTLKS